MSDDPSPPAADEPSQDGAGTITSEWGDTLDFRVRQGCGLVNWVADGGTGRFEEASGLMSGVILPGIPGFVAVNAGTLTETVHRSVAQWEEVCRARFVSTLQLVDDTELEDGIASFRRAFPDPETVPRVGLEFLWVTGTVHE